MTLSDLAEQRARQTQLDDPADGVVVTAATASDDLVQVELIGRGYTVDVPWVSNGRLPAAGDSAVIVTTPRAAIALVVATGGPAVS